MSYRTVVAVPGAARLFGSSVVGRLPLGTSTISLVLFVHAVRGSFAAVGVVVAAFTVSAAAASPIQGGLVDRFGAVRVLGACALGSTAGLTGIVLAGAAGAPVWTLVAFALLAGALLPPIESCARAVWPRVAPDVPTREAGYSLDAVSQELIWTVGPLLVALAVALADPTAAVLMSAALTISGAALFASSPLVRGYGGADGEDRKPGRVPGQAAALLRILAPIVLMGIGLGASDVGLPALALDLGAPALGAVLVATLAAGSIAGGLWYGTRPWRADAELRYGALLLALGVLTVPLLFARSLPAALALTLLAGLAWSPVLANQYELAAKIAPSGSAVTIFAWCVAAIDGGIAAGSAAAGGTIDLTSARGAIAIALAAYLLSGAAALAIRRRGGVPVRAGSATR